MHNKKILAARQAKKRKKKLIASLVWGAAALALLAIAGYFVQRSSASPAGQAVPLETNATGHIPTGQNPGPFKTDPPASGNHYGQPMDAGFYESGDPATQVDYPEGYLLHNLEHGYVIFWYNCDLFDSQSECDALKDQIRSVMNSFAGVKLIAFPWASLDVPVVMTSWGYMQHFETFDTGQARAFIDANRNRAPEPNAP